MLVPTKMLKQFLVMFPCSTLLIHICSHPELRLFWSIYSLLFTTSWDFPNPLVWSWKNCPLSDDHRETATSPVMPTNKEAEATCQILTFEDLRASTPAMPNTLTKLREIYISIYRLWRNKQICIICWLESFRALWNPGGNFAWWVSPKLIRPRLAV